jgi:hypothetical protein
MNLNILIIKIFATTISKFLITWISLRLSNNFVFWNPSNLHIIFILRLLFVIIMEMYAFNTIYIFIKANKIYKKIMHHMETSRIKFVAAPFKVWICKTGWNKCAYM